MLNTKDNTHYIFPEQAPEQELYISHPDSRTASRNLIFRQRFLVNQGESLIPVSIAEIAYFFANDRWTYLVTKQNKQFLVEHKLKELEEIVPPDQFFRINRAYLVSCESIVSLKPYMKSQLLVRLRPQGTDKVIVSRRKSPILRRWLNS